MSQELKLEGKKIIDHNSLIDNLISTYDIYEVDLSKIKFQKEFDLNLVLGDEFNLKLHLIENDLRSKSYKSNLVSSQGKIDNGQSYTRLYKGYLDDNPENRVRLTFYNNVLNGFIKKGEKIYRILPLDKWTKANNIDKVILFCEEKYLPEEIHLGDDAIVGDMQTPGNKLKSIIYTNPVYNLSLAVEADYEWYQVYQGNSESTILSIINAADDLFESECNIKFNIENIDIYTTSGDPFTKDFSNGSALLNELSGHWGSVHSGIYTNVTCLFSCKSCPSCNYRGWGRQPGNYCAIRDGSYNYKVLAHEIGHNLGATHKDAYYGSPSSIMDSLGYLPGNNFWFTNANKSNISNEIDNRLITYSYFEENAICGNKTFSISNVPSGFTVTWPKSSTLTFNGASTGSPVVIKPFSTSTYGDGWVEPTLTKGSQIIKFLKDEFWVGLPDNSQIDMTVMFGQSPYNILCTNTEQIIAAGHPNAQQQGIESYYWDFGSWAPYHTGYDLGGITNSRPTFYFSGYPPASQVIKVAAHNRCDHLMTYAKSKTFYAQNCFGYRLVFSPNPATDETTMTIETTSPEEPVDPVVEWEMEVYSPAQNLKEKQTNLKGNSAKIQTAGWQEGVYVVRVKYNDEILTGKLVVKK